MPTIRPLSAIAICLCLGSAAWSESTSIRNGGDTFVTGAAVTDSIDSDGDTFIAARSASARGVSAGDLHVVGFDVSVSADALADLYAVGATVVVRGSVAEDLTATGFSVRTEATSETQGNVRIVGNTLTIEGAVKGALTATGADVILNAPVTGDVRIVAGTISFGPEAKIAGAFTYGSNKEIAVPERVVPEERVKFERINRMDVWDELDDIRREVPILPTFMSILFGFIVSLLFFVALGAVVLGFMPKRLESLRQSVTRAPGKSFMSGVVGLSMLFGIVPIIALTIIGIPAVPIAILVIVVAWILGYALGAYGVAMRIWTGLGGESEPGNLGRLLVFAASIIFVAMLNFIPFVGWVANYTLVLLGVGAMTNALFLYMIGNPVVALDVDMKPIED